LNTGKVEFHGSVKEDFVTVLSEDELRVFSDANPRPKDALMGDEAVMNFLKIK